MQPRKTTLFARLFKEIAQKFFFSKKNGPVTVADENSPVGREIDLNLDKYFCRSIDRSGTTYARVRAA